MIRASAAKSWFRTVSRIVVSSDRRPSGTAGGDKPRGDAGHLLGIPVAPGMNHTGHAQRSEFGEPVYQPSLGHPSQWGSPIQWGDLRRAAGDARLDLDGSSRLDGGASPLGGECRSAARLDGHHSLPQTLRPKSRDRQRILQRASEHAGDPLFIDRE
jgi:hypothetical protein